MRRRDPSKGRGGRGWLALLLGCAALCGCQQEMTDQPRYEALEASDFFPDGRSARPLVPGTVARGDLRDDEHLYTGRVGGQLATSFPMPVTREVLLRGQERYNIYCTPCHDRAGTGKGMIVRRGFPEPPSFHTPRLREIAEGHYFEVMTQGYGAMYDYADRIRVEDRWAIVAYIRALQLSQNATIQDVPADQRSKLEETSR